MIRQNIHDYDIIANRISDFKQLVLTKNDLHIFDYNLYYGGICTKMTGLQIDITKDIAEFAYNLAAWKEPQVINKSSLPDRTKEQKIFDLFMGDVTECLTCLYFMHYGITNILRYYDIERATNVYNRTLDFDLMLHNWTMGIKCIPNYYDSKSKSFKYMELRGDTYRTDRYFSQWVCVKKDGTKPDSKVDGLNLLKDITNNILDLCFIWLGGLIDKSGVGYKKLCISEPSFKAKVSNDKEVTRLRFTKDYDLSDYLQEIFKENGMAYQGIIV